MNRLTRFFHGLSLGLALLGLFAVYRLYSWSSSWPVEAMGAYFLAALERFPVWGFGALSLFAWILARWLDQPPRVFAEKRRHRLEVTAPSTFDAQHAPTADPPGVAGDQDSRLRSLHRRLQKRLNRRPDVVGWVDELLSGALQVGASDIHLQPLEDRTRILLRVAGELEVLTEFTSVLHEQVVRRIQVLSGLVTYQRESPQDGRIGLETPAGNVDVRVSVLPTQHGGKVVLRYVRGASGLIDIGHLGMDMPLRERFEAALHEPQGLVILTGPTGSGKTTTIYSALEHIHQERGSAINIATLEDPIEVELPFLNQTQIARHRGLSFDQALRAVLRQDPNVLMIGEIRDQESAAIAVQAGLTGHLILTSLHADSAVGTFHRLIDIGVEPFLVASSVRACISQRLTRALCSDCRQPVRLSRSERSRFARQGLAIDGFTFYRSVGCDACGGQGHRGRTAIFELLRVSKALQQSISHRAAPERLFEQAVKDGMVPLPKAALQAAAAGRISLDDVLEILG